MRFQNEQQARHSSPHLHPALCERFNGLGHAGLQLVLVCGRTLVVHVAFHQVRQFGDLVWLLVLLLGRLGQVAVSGLVEMVPVVEHGGVDLFPRKTHRA